MNKNIKFWILFYIICFLLGFFSTAITSYFLEKYRIFNFEYKKVFAFAEEVNLSPTEEDNQVFKVVDCESKWNKHATGTAGEIGIGQYMPQTFNWLKKKAKMEWLDINENDDQIELLRWSINNNWGKLWSCY